MASTYDSTNRNSAQKNLAEQGGRVVSEVQELGRVALDSAGEAASTLREKGREALESGKERAVAAKGQFDKLVSAHPMKSVLIAAGVGAALGFALSRRSR